MSADSDVDDLVRVGGNISRYKAVFSLDNKLFFCCVLKTVKMYSVATGENVGSLEGHTSTVVGVVPNPSNHLQVYSASHDGTVKLWDFYESNCLETYSIGHPIMHFVLSNDSLILNVNKAYFSARSPGQSQSCRIATIDLKSKKAEPIVRYRSKACCAIAISPCRTYVATISKSTLTIWNTKTDKRVKHTHARSLTTIAFHPTDPLLATGDQKGQIVLWHRFDDADSLVTSSLHWHAHEVSSLAFTDDGAYMLSGGEEAVLVFWQLATGHRHYLPRLGNKIQHIAISPCGSFYLLSCADNTVRIINAVTSKVTQQVRGLAHGNVNLGQLAAASKAPSAKATTKEKQHHDELQRQRQRQQLQRQRRTLASGLVVDPRRNFVVLGGLPGTIQFYDAFNDKHVASLDVVNRNLVSRTDGGQQLVSRVEQFCFSQSGKWLATIDRMVNAEVTDSMTLRVFQWNEGTATYQLNTRIEQPHKERVVSMGFVPKTNPTEPAMLVTASNDTTFKVWKEKPLPRTHSVKQSKNKGRLLPQTSNWSCVLSSSYRGFIPHHLSFSPDGSLLAVAFGQVVTLWEMSSLSLVHTLLHPPPCQPIRFVKFCTGGPYLVAATSEQVYVWNLLTAAVWWSCELAVTSLATDTISSCFAVAVYSGAKKTRRKKQLEAEEAKEEGKGRDRKSVV